MKKIHVAIGDHRITALISRYGVHIISDEALHEMMKCHPVRHTETLSNELLNRFQETNNRKLRISSNSLVMEIWGHYLFEKAFPYISIPFRHKVFRKIADRLEKSTHQIDCAELRHDGNRFIWDALAPFKRIAQFLLFKKRK